MLQSKHLAASKYQALSLIDAHDFEHVRVVKLLFVVAVQ